MPEVLRRDDLPGAAESPDPIIRHEDRDVGGLARRRACSLPCVRSRRVAAAKHPAIPNLKEDPSERDC
jgi:hypothetical protein